MKIIYEGLTKLISFGSKSQRYNNFIIETDQINIKLVAFALRANSFARVLCISVFMLMMAGILYSDVLNVKIGDNLDKVYEELGEPDSYILIGKRTLVSYERGKIELVSNKVSKVDFVSAAKAKELKVKAREDVKRRRDYLVREGNAVKQRKLEDADFLSLSLSEQVDFWHSFRGHYPMIDLEPVNLADLAAKAAEETKRRQMAFEESRAEKTELLLAKRQLKEAEERARQAEEAARSRSRYSPLYTSYLYPPQVIIPGGNYPCKKPRPTPYGTIQPVSPFRPGGGSSVVGGITVGGSSSGVFAPHASQWPSHTPGVFPNTVR